MTHLVVSPNRIHRTVDRMFNDFFGSTPLISNADADFSPQVNITENDDLIRLEFELPGMEKDDIKVTLKDGLLAVSGERKVQQKDENENFVRSEIYTGQFSRSFTLPESVNTDKISADYKNGMLLLTLPKSEKAKPKQINVKIS